jgi:HK97 family phage prohead protease
MAKNVEKRFVDAGFEVRSEEGKPITVSGYAAVFEDETVIGGAFAERVAKGAFDGADMSNTVALFNHDMNQPLARVGRGLELTVDERGLRYSFELGNQSYAKDLAENIRMGNVGTSSFGFTVEDDNWERRDDGVNLRTINKVGLLFDVSPTTQGAYPTTEVGLRSMELALANEEVLKIEDEEVRNELEDQEVREEETNEEEQEERAPGYDSDYDGVKDEDEEEEEEERMSEEDEEEEEEEEERSASTHDCGDCNCDGDCANNENPEPEARNNNISNSKNMKEKNPAPAIIQGMGDTEGKLKKRYSFGKAIQEAAKGGLTGLEAEMSQEARNEFANAKVNVSGGFSVPSFVLRSDTDPMGVGATSNGTLENAGNTIGIQDAGLIAAYRPGDIATAMGVRTINNATGDIAFSVQGAEIVAEKPAEGAAVTQDAADFSEVKLSPVRYAAYSRVTEQLLAQTADDMGSFIARDIRAAIDEKYNTDVFGAINTAATTAASGADSLGDILDIEADLLAADIPLENVRVLAGAGAYRQAREVSMDAGSGLLIAGSPAGRRSVLGYDATVSSSVTSGNIYMVDNANMVQCNWGGLNILVDPYTDAPKGVVRIVCNVYKDFKVLNNAGFHGLTSFDGA